MRGQRSASPFAKCKNHPEKNIGFSSISLPKAQGQNGMARPASLPEASCTKAISLMPHTANLHSSTPQCTPGPPGVAGKKPDIYN